MMFAPLISTDVQSFSLFDHVILLQPVSVRPHDLLHGLRRLEVPSIHTSGGASRPRRSAIRRRTSGRLLRWPPFKRKLAWTRVDPRTPRLGRGGAPVDQVCDP